VDGSVGETAWISCAGGLPWGQSSDQRPDEARSLTYTWEPLSADLDLFGHPVLRLTVTCDRPTAYLSAKITDVFPDGTSSLVVRGMANLAYREPGTAIPVTPGEPIELELELEAIAWTLEAGHRLRLDLAGSDWPNAWPPPDNATLTIDRSTGELELPVLDGPPPIAERPPITEITGHQHSTDSTDDGWWRWEVTDDGPSMRIARTGYGGTAERDGAALRYRDRYEGVVGVSRDEPGVAFAEGDAEYEIRYPEAAVRTSSHVRVDSDPQTYRVRIELVADEDGQERFRKTWERTFPRELQ
jgi:hypothetical protein